jgi:hypothetical protein
MRGEIMDDCTSQFKITFTRGWVNFFALRGSDEVIQTKLVPQEKQRSQVPRAVLLMDNCSAHVSDDLIRILTEAKVHLITFVPHATQIFQVLVLTIFGVPKRCPRYDLPFDKENATIKIMIKVNDDFRQTMARPMSGEHFVHLDLSLTWEESRMGFCLTT